MTPVKGLFYPALPPGVTAHRLRTTDLVRTIREGCVCVCISDAAEESSYQPLNFQRKKFMLV